MAQRRHAARGRVVLPDDFCWYFRPMLAEQDGGVTIAMNERGRTGPRSVAVPALSALQNASAEALSRRARALFAKRLQGVRERRTDRFSDIAILWKSRAATNAFPGQSASCHVITPRSSHVRWLIFRPPASPGPPVPSRGNWVTNVEADEIDLRHHGRIMIASIAHAACRNFRRRLPARQISLDPARCMNRLSGSLLGPVAYLDYLD
jgi:hypothetical protein